MRPYIHPETVALMVQDYEEGREHRLAEAEWWAGAAQPFSEVVERVGRADLSGKRHPHQRRLTRSALDAGTAALHQIANEFERAPDFHRLWSLVADAFAPIRGLGERRSTTRRIGCAIDSASSRRM